MSIRPPGNPDSYNENTLVEEFLKVSQEDIDDPYGFLYFVTNYVKIYDNDSQGWIPFELWDTDCNPYDNQWHMSLYN